MKPRHAIEAAGLLIAGAIFRLLPIDGASALGGFIFRKIGPLISANRIAERNLRASLPELDDPSVKRILRGMWDNLGRTAAEYVYLDRFSSDPGRVEVVDKDNLLEKLRQPGEQCIFVTAHYDNWEIASIANMQAGIRQTNIYRAPNNPLVESLLRRARGHTVTGGLYPKGRRGMRQIVTSIRKGHCIGMVADQKSNEGIALPFFGRDAMTTTVPASLARRYNCPIVLSRVKRLRGAWFQVTVEELPIDRAGDRDKAILDATRRINAAFETWIRERPEAWLWVHRRWPG